MEGVGGFGVYVLHHWEDVQDVLLCEGRFVAAVKVVLLDQDLRREIKNQWVSGRSRPGGERGVLCDRGSDGYLYASLDGDLSEERDLLKAMHLHHLIDSFTVNHRVHTPVTHWMASMHICFI